MAESLLVRLLAERGAADRVTVRSAGIAPYARDGALVSLDARIVLRENGIDEPAKTVSTDLARNPQLLAEADLILAMTSEQIAMLRRRFPATKDKPVWTWKEFAGQSGDIEDPAGRGEEVHAACFREIAATAPAVVRRLLEGP